jgi:hypothetical protein
MTAMLLTGTSAAYAAEVPAGVTEVKIPLALESASAIAGAEISFTQSGGLEYVRFEPAGGTENPMKTTVGANTWIGFFSATNKYLPSDGTLSFGNLVFRYDGGEPENVTIAETRLHSLTGVDSDVKSVRGKPNTIIPVTRRTSGAVDRNDDPIIVSTRPPDEGGGANDSGDTGGVNSVGNTNETSSANGTSDTEDANSKAGANNSNDANDKSGKSGSSNASSKSGANSSGGKNNSGTKSSGGKNNSGASNTNGSSGASNANGSSGNAGAANAANTTGDTSQTTVGGVADSEIVAASGEAEASAMVPFSTAPETIADGDIPLAGAMQTADAQSGLPAWWIVAALIAGVLAGALVMFLVLKRRRRKDSKPDVIEKIYISSR